MRDESIDRSKWAHGEWDNEPDRKCWVYRQVPCLITRHPSMGHLCGYIGVMPGHPWYYKTDDQISEAVCHGGLTYAKIGNKYIDFVPDPQSDEEKGFQVALLANRGAYYDWLLEKGREWEAFLVNCSMQMWWIGFDAAHAWDVVPEMRRYTMTHPPTDNVYRNMQFMTDEVESLAEQYLLAGMKVGAA